VSTATRAGERLQVSPARRLSGTLSVPGDKSISHRAAMFNAIAEGRSRVSGYSPGGDCRSTLACLRQLGVEWTSRVDQANLELRIAGRGLRGLEEPADTLDAGNSGTTVRLMSGILAGQPGLSILDGDASLRRRPMRRIVEPLRAMGATVLGRQQGDRLPLAISGGELRGQIFRPAAASAQVKSCLLLAGLFADGPTTVIEQAATRDHTERMLGAQGARLEIEGLARTIWPVERLAPIVVDVPGDFSSAAYWLTLACVHPDARVTIRNVGLNPFRTGLLDTLSEMGARISVEKARQTGGEPIGDVTAESSELRGVEVGGERIPRMVDEVPLLAVAALFARGATVVRDAAELRVKESDRLATTARELARLGASIEERDDGLLIRGGRRLVEAEVETHLDHRLAMCLAVAGLAGAGAVVRGADVASVSYPSFWDDARALGAAIVP
jgi:3-phosphoshikimate 1-carboxyvinyltransferase